MTAFFVLIFTGLALVAEVLQLSILGAIPFPFTRHLLIAKLLCDLRTHWAIGFCAIGVTISSFLQGNNITTATLYPVAMIILWHYARGKLSRASTLLSAIGMAFMLSSFVIEGTWYWTPLTVIANIIMIPVVIKMWCRV